MSKRKQRERNRLEAGLEQIRIGDGYCLKHQRPPTEEEFREKRCYTGNRGKTWCKYWRKYG